MRGRLTEGIVPSRNELHPNPRQFPPAGLEECRFGERYPGAHYRRTASRPRFEAGTIIVVHREKSEVLELAESRLVREQGERRLAAGEHSPTSVHDQSPRGAAAFGLQIVVPRQTAELLAPDDLELPETDGQQDDERPERVARHRQPAADAGETFDVDHYPPQTPA